MEEAELKEGVAESYDESSWVMEGIWGDHLHHGIYVDDDPSHQEEHKAFASLPRAAQIRTIQAAQIRTIDEALRFAAVSDAMEQPFPDGLFDLVWSMECGEHIHDKRKDIKAADWSEYFTPFWLAVLRTLLNWKGVTSVTRAGRVYISELGFSRMECDKGSIGDPTH